MMVVMCLSVLAKVASKLWKTHKLQGDDLSVVAAIVRAVYLLERTRIRLVDANFDDSQVIAVGQTIATSEQVAAGLGQHKADLNASQISKYQQVRIRVRAPWDGNYSPTFLRLPIQLKCCISCL